MARGRKSGPSKADRLRERAKGLQAGQFLEFIDEVSEARQELADANTSHASVWKKADKIGIHPAAAKLVVRLDKMDSLKRADFLRSFMQMHAFMRADRWDDQVDLLDQEQEATPLEQAIDRTKPATDKPVPLGDVVQDLVAETADKPAYDVASPPDLPSGNGSDHPAALEADWGEDGADGASPELDNAGYTFANGRTAGQQGHGPETNPHPASSPSHAIWERGRAQGAKEQADPLLEEGDEPQAAKADAPKSSRGRRRAAATDGANVVPLH